MAKRFTFKDAKEKIAQLEAEIVDLKDRAIEDVKEDAKVIGFGDVAFFVAGILVTIIFKAIF